MDKNIESYCFPDRIMKSCEFQLGVRGLSSLGGTINQLSHEENKFGFKERVFKSENIKGTYRSI